MNFKKTIFLFLFLFSYGSINALNYYLRNGGGSWNDSSTWSTESSSSSNNAGTFPIAGDNVYFNGSGTVNLNITANAYCLNFYNESETGAIVNLLFSDNITLAVSGLFQITTTSGVSRTTNVKFASGSTTATMTVGHIFCGTVNTSYTACANVMSLAGPDVTVSGNVNIINNTDGTVHMRSMISHTAGKLKLTGTTRKSGSFSSTTIPTSQPTSGSGYLNTFQYSGNLSSNNKYQMSYSATLELYHVTQTATSSVSAFDVPIYVQQTTIGFPTLTNVTYHKHQSLNIGGYSNIYNGSYAELTINNPAKNIVMNNFSVSTLNIKEGSLDLNSKELTVANLGKINVNSQGVTIEGVNFGKSIINGKVVFEGTYDLKYFGDARKTGVELRSYSSYDDKGLNSINIDGTSSFDLGTIFINETPNTSSTLNIKDNMILVNNTALTLNTLVTINCPNIYFTGSCNIESTLVEVDKLHLSSASISYTKSNNINELIVNSNSTINGFNTGSLNVLSQIMILSENTTLTTTNSTDLKLISNNNNTARVSEIPNNSTISGKVTVQRFIPRGRKWRLLTAPLKISSSLSNENNPKINSIYYNWQNNNIIISQFGTDLWGPGGGPSNNPMYNMDDYGLYNLQYSTHNFRKYTNGSWISVQNSKIEPLFNDNNGKNPAFLTFIVAPFGSGIQQTGEDEEGNPIFDGINESSSTTLEAKGELIIGEQSYDLSGTTYHLIGNPYASPIDFSEIISANSNAIDPKIWILDPTVSALGNYITWDPINKYGDVTSQHHTNNTTIIQSGQGFFVRKKTGEAIANLIIKEDNKTSGNYNNVIGRYSNSVERIRVAVSKLEDNTDVHKDACVVGFYEGASNAVTGNDVQKFTNASETLAFVNGTTSLSSEHRLPVVNGDVLFIKLTNATTSNYKLKIHTENFAFTGEAVFHDLKLGTSMAMPLDGSLFEYPFDVTSDATTQGTRFKIVFNTTLGIDDTANLSGIKVYPNPSTNSLGVTLNTGNLELGNYEYKILNVLGQAIQDGKIENVQINQEIKINFNNAITSGWYTIQILDNNKIVNSLPIIIK